MTIKKILLFCAFSLFMVAAFCQKPERVKTYYANGKLKERGKVVGADKIGLWNYYSSSGYLERKEKWIHGKMQWAIVYNEKTQKVKMINSDGTEKLYKGCNCKN